MIPDNIHPPIAVDPITGEMRDIVSPAPSADPPVSPRGPLAEFGALPTDLAPLTHRTNAYGCWIDTSLDHTHAVLTPLEGDPVEFTTRLTEEPTAFAKAIIEAKERWKAEKAEQDAQRQATRSRLIDEAAAKNRKGQ